MTAGAGSLVSPSGAQNSRPNGGGVAVLAKAPGRRTWTACSSGDRNLPVLGSSLYPFGAIFEIGVLQSHRRSPRRQPVRDNPARGLWVVKPLLEPETRSAQPRSLPYEFMLYGTNVELLDYKIKTPMDMRMIRQS